MLTPRLVADLTVFCRVSEQRLAQGGYEEAVGADLPIPHTNAGALHGECESFVALLKRFEPGRHHRVERATRRNILLLQTLPRHHDPPECKQQAHHNGDRKRQHDTRTVSQQFTGRLRTHTDIEPCKLDEADAQQQHNRNVTRPRRLWRSAAEHERRHNREGAHRS